MLSAKAEKKADGDHPLISTNCDHTKASKLGGISQSAKLHVAFFAILTLSSSVHLEIFSSFVRKLTRKLPCLPLMLFKIELIWGVPRLYEE